ncbi:Uncharacterized protein SCF082_LOCUS4909 [Durusdinium trenchii]|uniref:VWFA domain-containing protein n=1 Tax=Durusdinium trenchii TaxID=1381693 RepID=A0ABP0I272_9DINO
MRGVSAAFVLAWAVANAPALSQGSEIGNITSVSVSEFADAPNGCDAAYSTPDGARQFIFRQGAQRLDEVINGTSHSYLSNVKMMSLTNSSMMWILRSNNEVQAYSLDVGTPNAIGVASTITGTVFTMYGPPEGDHVLLGTTYSPNPTAAMTREFKYLDDATTWSPGRTTKLDTMVVQTHGYTIAWGAKGSVIHTFSPSSISSTGTYMALGTGGSGGLDGGRTVGEVPALPHFALAENDSRLYVASEDGHTLRHVDIGNGNDLAITTLAGDHGASGDVVGNGTVARFDAPKGISVVEVSAEHHRLFMCDSGNNKIKQIDITIAPACSTRVVLAVDRTYTKNPGRPVAKAREFTRTLVDNLAFPGVKMGFVNLLSSKAVTVRSVDDALASDASAWGRMVNTIDGGWNSRATAWKPLFGSIPAEVSQADTKSMIILITDGNLKNGSKMKSHIRRRKKVGRQFGADAPEFVCVLIREKKPSKFLREICDTILREGKDGKTLTQQAQELGAAVCE